MDEGRNSIEIIQQSESNKLDTTPTLIGINHEPQMVLSSNSDIDDLGLNNSFVDSYEDQVEGDPLKNDKIPQCFRY